MIRRIFPGAFAILMLACLSGAATTPRKASLVVNQMDGGKFNVGQYSGKVVIFAAIMTACPHCQDTTRALAGMQKEFGPKGLQVLEAAMDQKPDVTVPQFIASYNPPFPVGSVNFIEVATFMGLDPGKRFSVPCVTFVDRKGTIRAQYQGSDSFLADAVRDKNIREMAQKLLAEK